MNYIVDVVEFWIYIFVSFGIGCFVTFKYCLSLYEKREQELTEYYHKKLDKVIGEFSSVNNEELRSEQETKEKLLKKANKTIKLANIRINELKATIEELKKKQFILDELNHFELLGASEDSDITQIKKNYKKLSMIYHPDYSKSQTMMKLINEAYNRAT